RPGAGNHCRPVAGQDSRPGEAWLLSPELVSISYAATELDLFEPVARQVGPAAYKVGPRNSEWVATLYLAQPVRQGAGGIWVITRTGSPAG
ncbi:MAG TPA: hypothetical protein VFO47_12225, partial [Actinomycetes bacterium]|nr:hypothetical protein [Actinomycetes bacterium]